MARQARTFIKMWGTALGLLFAVAATAQEPSDSTRLAADSLRAVVSQARDTISVAATQADSVAQPVPGEPQKALKQPVPQQPSGQQQQTAQPPLKLDSLASAALAGLKPKTFLPDPIRSQWVALVLPGGGQIYNRKFWKLPVIYGGFLGCAYALSWNAQMLRDYSQAYLDIMDSDPDTKSYEKMLPLGYDISGREDKFKEIFKNKKNYYRKYRDMSILAFALVYVIGVIDAYVDAELSSFDISPDLSLRMTPAIVGGSPSETTHIGNGQNSVGFALTLDF